MSRSLRGAAAGLFAVALMAPVAVAQAQEPPRVQAGAPGEPSRVMAPGEVLQHPRFVQADVEFMQMMIPHHAQATIMTALVAERTDSRDIHMLARRIELSQDDEIALMTRWLRARGQEVPEFHLHDPREHAAHAAHGGHGDHHAQHHGAHEAHEAHGGGHDMHLMHGMLTNEELDQLAAARGREFDRLFLEFMIRHHEGAILMVQELFATDGAGQEGELFEFASHVDSDQRMEIERMQAMLRALEGR